MKPENLSRAKRIILKSKTEELKEKIELTLILVHHSIKKDY